MNSKGLLDWMGEKKKAEKDIKAEIINAFGEIHRLKEKFDTIKDCNLSKETIDAIKKEMNTQINDIKTEMHDLIDLINTIE